MCFRPYSAFQSFFSVLTHISPFFATLGWNIFVKKKPFGGSTGKLLPRTSLTEKWPPAYGVPSAIKQYYRSNTTVVCTNTQNAAYSASTFTLLIHITIYILNE